MERLFNPDITCTDPDQLQFCLKISDTVFWYCQPNIYHDDLLPESSAPAGIILYGYLGNPKALLERARTDPAVKALVRDRNYWLTGEIDVEDFTHEE